MTGIPPRTNLAPNLQLQPFSRIALAALDWLEFVHTLHPLVSIQQQVTYTLASYTTVQVERERERERESCVCV